MLSVRIKFQPVVLLGGQGWVGEVLQSFPSNGRATVTLPAGIELVIVVTLITSIKLYNIVRYFTAQQYNNTWIQ